MIKKLLIYLVLVCLFVSCGLENLGERTAFINAHLIDGTGAAPIENGILLLHNDRIVKAGATISIPKGYQKIDLKGKTLLPGFINSHVHWAYDSKVLKTWLKAGVTTVRDLGPFIEEDFIALRDDLNQDPSHTRLVSSTPLITAKDGYGFTEVEGPEEAEALVKDYIERGVDIIKIVIEPRLPPITLWRVLGKEECDIIVKTAHAHNIPVSCHLTLEESIDQAIESEVDDLAHMVVDILPKEKAQAVVNAGIYWVPTLELWAGTSKLHRLNWINRAKTNLNLFYKLGGKIALGTDYAGYEMSFDQGFPITEVRLMREAGMSVLDIITAGTKNAAYVCGLGQTLGTLEADKKADILILHNNPLEDIEAFLNPYAVIKDGKIIKN